MRRALLANRHAHALQREELAIVGKCLAHQEFERAVGRLQFVTLEFHLLDAIQHALARLRIEQLVPPLLLKLEDDVAASGQVTDQDSALVPDGFRRHVLVCLGVAQHGADVDAALMRERALADEAGTVRETQVRHVRDVIGERSQLGDVVRT